MSTILYYSNFCEHSKKLLQTLSKTKVSQELHFLCIDRRAKERDGKTYLVMENGQKMILPETITKVPALLLLNQNGAILYGDQIHDFLRPKNEEVTRQATSNNMEPMAFALGGGANFGGIVSDNFSFLDQGAEDLNAKGNGGLRQMHNYFGLDSSDTIPTPTEDFDQRQSRSGDGGQLTVEQLQQQREQELSALTTNRKLN
jgi:hypothetical protein